MRERGFTSAQRIASAHRKLAVMAEEFEQLLQELIRSGKLEEVADTVTLVDTETGSGLRLSISAELLTAEQVAKARRHA
jgi:hypothetical protein